MDRRQFLQHGLAATAAAGVGVGVDVGGLTGKEAVKLVRAAISPKLDREITIRYEGKTWTEPTVVVEVAFDVIVRSNRHQSGFSLRFPRIARLRPDKSPDEIDTLESVRALY